MSSHPQNPGAKGSLKHIQRLVNDFHGLLENEIKRLLPKGEPDPIQWVSPLAAYSGPNRPPIPGQIVHPFRLNSSTDSGAIRPLIPAQIVHRFRSNSSGAAASVRS